MSIEGEGESDYTNGIRIFCERNGLGLEGLRAIHCLRRQGRERRGLQTKTVPLKKRVSSAADKRKDKIGVTLTICCTGGREAHVTGGG